MLRFFFRLSLLLILLILLGVPAFLLVSATQRQPLVKDVGGMLHGDVGRIKDLLTQNDPRQLRDGETRRLQITGRDLNLMLNSVLPNPQRQGLQVDLATAGAEVRYTLELPANPLGQFLNISALLRQDGPRLALQQLDFGDVALPAWLLAPLAATADGYLRHRSAEYRDVMTALKDIQVQPQALHIVYQWQSGLAERLQSTGRDLFLPTEDRQRVLAYYAEIARQSESLGRGAVSLDHLLQPLFALALQRSAQGNDAAAENRALLLALGVAVSGNSIEHLVGKPDGAAPPPRPMKLVLRGRNDLAKHFSISAAITAAGGSGLADQIGVFKEVDDSRGGSGFSFADLLADRAGVSLAEVALGKNAGAVQRFMSKQLQEAGYMPGLNNLPEGLMELEFKSRYEDLDSANYALVNGEIERRIGNCALHQPGLNQAQ